MGVEPGRPAGRLRARLFGRSAAPAEGPAGPGEAAGPGRDPSAETLTPEETSGFYAAATTESLSEGGGEAGVAVAGSEAPVPIATPAEPSGRAGAISERLHDWLPIAIVVVSVFAAVMGWLASVADESATRSDELARQDFVSQQSTLLSKTQSVDSDLRQFGTFEQYSLMGQQLLSDAGKVGGAEGQSLAREGQADVQVARSLASQLPSLSYSPVFPEDYYNSSTGSGPLQANGTYRPGNPPDARSALTGVLSGDTDLITLEPERLQAQASGERSKGVHLVGVAALFIAGLVFFTFAALSRGPRTIWFSSFGVIVGLVALVLFPIVQFS